MVLHSELLIPVQYRMHLQHDMALPCFTQVTQISIIGKLAVGFGVEVTGP
jgi:hypothetical protein